MKIPVIFDTDAGSDVDDLYALGLVLRHPNLHPLGVTTVGSADPHARARLVAKMLRLAKREDVPVFAGRPTCDALLAQGKQRLSHGHFVTADDPEQGRHYGDAMAFMLQSLAEAEAPITLIATGPWSNIAEVLRRADERQRANIGSLALMGGEVHLMHAEANASLDPQAAHDVLTSGLPIFLGTWSVTRRLFFTMAEVEQRLANAPDPFLRGLYTCTRMWWGEGRGAKPGPVCYDVVPVFWAAGEREDIACIGLRNIRVELEGRFTRGMTWVHPWTREAAPVVDAPSPGCVLVTDAMDAAALKRRFEQRVFGGQGA
jgi:purine nucleosidase